MAVDKLVDSTQLNADLTSIANAIRAKTGGSSQLAFPTDFGSVFNSIVDIPDPSTACKLNCFKLALGTTAFDVGALLTDTDPSLFFLAIKISSK